ncbi:hypothetical protein IKS86_01165 [bacterium]|nr:hypothetical protein [bacterium]
MKKAIITVIIIAAAIAIFAVVAGQTDSLSSVQSEKPAVEKKIESKELKKNIKVPLKTLKMQKLNIDKLKLKNNIQKSKEKSDFNKDQKKCGE